ncbi:hypothetical protein ILYODFUR_006376 [Ilyodon furcidens]|uniref:Uncharacterized protein n=1 Tax=Ilyodon furcidens TaxID=33524 RepID=A0ABV0VEF4_9TELE
MHGCEVWFPSGADRSPHLMFRLYRIADTLIPSGSWSLDGEGTRVVPEEIGTLTPAMSPPLSVHQEEFKIGPFYILLMLPSARLISNERQGDNRSGARISWTRCNNKYTPDTRFAGETITTI